MVSEPVLFDANILIDFMNGIPQAEHEIDIHPDRAISVITWIEVLAGTTLEDVDKTNDLLRAFEMIPITSDIAAEAVSARRVNRLKLPDALILTTARVENRFYLPETQRFPKRPSQSSSAL